MKESGDVDVYPFAERLAEKVHRSITLCGRCRRGIVFTRATGLVTAYCNMLGQEVPTDIVECTGFRNKKELDIDQLQSIALPIDARIGVNERAYK